jgi:hypothetical protein
MTTVASAETLVTEFQLRGIHAYRSHGATEHACHATINKVEVNRQTPDSVGLDSGRPRVLMNP